MRRASSYPSSPASIMGPPEARPQIRKSAVGQGHCATVARDCVYVTQTVIRENAPELSVRGEGRCGECGSGSRRPEEGSALHGASGLEGAEREGGFLQRTRWPPRRQECCSACKPAATCERPSTETRRMRMNFRSVLLPAVWIAGHKTSAPARAAASSRTVSPAPAAPTRRRAPGRGPQAMRALRGVGRLRPHPRRRPRRPRASPAPLSHAPPSRSSASASSLLLPRAGRARDPSGRASSTSSISPHVRPPGSYPAGPLPDRVPRRPDPPDPPTARTPAPLPRSPRFPRRRARARHRSGAR
jgi:hypothetical protein